MRRYFGLTGMALWWMACGLTACAAGPSVSAGQLISPAAAVTLPPATTHAPAAVTATRTPTRTPSPTPTPTRTATAQPTATKALIQTEPTAVLSSISIAPPAPDGVVRTADVPILMYHYISSAPFAQDRIRYGLSVSPEMFEAQLKLLHDGGFATVTLRELYEYLAVGTPLPAKPIILTFDDGYLDNYTNAFPILRKYGMVGTFFVLTGPADDGDPVYLSWDMIQEMSNAGMDIQLHAREHVDMRNRPYDWLVFQIIGGRQSIEGHTGKPVIFMAYPSGRYDANLQRFLNGANFWAAVTTASGSRHMLKDALTWDRVRISGQLRLQDFAKLLGIRVPVQRAMPSPTVQPSATLHPGGPAASLVPTTMPANTGVPPLTPTASLTPSDGTAYPTPSAGTVYPTQTPMSSPLVTPTSGPSPLATPAL